MEGPCPGGTQPRSGAGNTVSLRERPGLTSSQRCGRASRCGVDRRPPPPGLSLGVPGPVTFCSAWRPLPRGPPGPEQRRSRESLYFSNVSVVRQFLPRSGRHLYEVSLSAQTHSLCRAHLLRVTLPPSSCPGCVSFPPPRRSPMTAAPVTVDRDAGGCVHQPLPLWPGSGPPPPVGSPWRRGPCGVAGPAACSLELDFP